MFQGFNSKQFQTISEPISQTTDPVPRQATPRFVDVASSLNLATLKIASKAHLNNPRLDRLDDAKDIVENNQILAKELSLIIEDYPPLSSATTCLPRKVAGLNSPRKHTVSRLSILLPITVSGGLSPAAF